MSDEDGNGEDLSPENDTQGQLTRKDLSPLQPGTYQHYKGGIYEVLGTAISSEDQEIQVIYRSYAHGTLWVRPLKMFIENIGTTTMGNQVARFKKVDDLP